MEIHPQMPFCTKVLLARRLVKVARMLVAFNRSELENQLKKRSDLKEDVLKEHLDCLEDMDAKEQKVALYWISKKRLILPEDLSKFNEAMNLINKQHLDFQEFEGPMEVINRNDKSTLRIKSQDIDFSPSSERAFSSPYNAGDGVVIYEVEDSSEGQQAVRKAIDVNWGYDKNPWCLAARKNGFGHGEISVLSHEQAEKLGLYSDDTLAVAWNYWKHYNAYPKRIAFKNGKLFAFSAGKMKQHVEWWDRNDKSHYTIPGSNAADDIEFLKKHGKLNLLDGKNASPEMIEELAEDEDRYMRRAVAENLNTTSEALMKLAEDEDVGVRHAVAENRNAPVKAIMKLAEDENERVRSAVAENPRIPVEFLRKFAEDNFFDLRGGVAKNPNTPSEILRKLAEDKDEYVRQKVACNPHTPVEVLMKLAEEENWRVREGIATNSSTPAEILRKFAEDKNAWVRYAVTKNPSAPSEALRKLAEDEDRKVRWGVAINPSTPAEAFTKLAGDESVGVIQGIARNPSTPAEVLRKLAEDEDKDVRYEVAGNPSAPSEVLRKLAEDKDERVREVAMHRLKQ